MRRKKTLFGALLAALSALAAVVGISAALADDNGALTEPQQSVSGRIVAGGDLTLMVPLGALPTAVHVYVLDPFGDGTVNLSYIYGEGNGGTLATANVAGVDQGLAPIDDFAPFYVASDSPGPVGNGVNVYVTYDGSSTDGRALVVVDYDLTEPTDYRR